MAIGKSEYWRTPEGLLELEGGARDGLTDEQLAHNCGISASTLEVMPDVTAQIFWLKNRCPEK